MSLEASPAPAPVATPAPAAVTEPTPTPSPAPTPAAKPAVKPATSLLADPVSTTEPAPVATTPANWPDNWRELLAGDDQKALAELKRYASPKALNEARIAARNRIAKGDLQKVLGPNPTPEEIAEYRQVNGIPETPDAYKIALPDGRVVGDEDKPVVAQILKSMHAINASPAVANAAVAAYFDIQDDAIAAREDADIAAKTKAEDELRLEYGQDFRGNLNAVKGLLGTWPNGTGQKLLQARAADGSLIFNDPDMVRALVHMSRELNPIATIAPGSSASAETIVVDELSKYKAMMADGTWDTHPDRAKFKARYEQLIEAKDKLKARA